MANILHTERAANKITLGTTGTTINIASHTASKLLALDASKNLESITDLVVDTTNHRVGIGTATPSLKLDVKGSPNTTFDNCPLLMQVHTIDAYADGMGGGISLGGRYDATRTTTFGYIAGVKDGAAEGDTAGKLILGVRPTGGGGVDMTAITILGTGNVGIGITIPTARLHLSAGTAAASTAPLKLTSGTDLTTPEAGVIEYDGSHFSVTEVMDRRVLSVASDSITTAVTVVDTVTETTVFTAPISANELHAGKVFRIYGFGQASTHDANDTLTIRIKIGTTLLTSLGAIPGQAADDPFHFVNTITVRTIGGGGTIASHGHIMIKDTEVHQNDQNVAVNTTAAENITVTLQWNDANAGNTATLDQCFLEVLV